MCFLFVSWGTLWTPEVILGRRVGIGPWCTWVCLFSFFSSTKEGRRFYDFLVLPSCARLPAWITNTWCRYLFLCVFLFVFRFLLRSLSSGGGATTLCTWLTTHTCSSPQHINPGPNYHSDRFLCLSGVILSAAHDLRIRVTGVNL